MNTLPRAITARFFTFAEYLKLRQLWSRLMNSERKHELSAAHHLLYLALIGKDWRKGFAPVTNPRKLANGAFQSWMLFRALNRLHMRFWEEQLLAPFDETVTPQMLAIMRELIPCQSSYSYRTEQFEAGKFPFDAYTVSESLPGDTPIQDANHA
jgi:hypothetical protein